MAKLLEYENGLRVCVVPLPIRSVMTGIWVGTGSRYESASDNGISHFTEHVMFKGTHKMSAYDIANAFEGYGASVNAFTSKESTCYYYKCIDKYNDQCFALLSDIFFNSVFPEEELDKERKVIVEEINMVEDAPDEICSDLMFSAAFGDSVLGQTILGPKQNVMRFTGDDVKKYIEKRYTADNVVIVFAGNISEEDADRLIRGFVLDKFKNGRCNDEKKPAAFITGRQLKRIKDTEQTNIVLAFPSVSLCDERRIVVQSVLSCLFGGGMSSRLFQSIRERKGLAYSIYTMPAAYSDAGAFTVCMNNSPDNTRRALLSVKDEIEKLCNDGITEDELKRSKIQLVSSLAFSEESVQSQMMSFGKALICTNNMFDINHKIELTESIRKEEVEQFVREYISRDLLTAAYVGKAYDDDILEIMK